MTKLMVIGFQYKIGLHVLNNVVEVLKQDKELVFLLEMEEKNVQDLLQKIDIVIIKNAHLMSQINKYNNFILNLIFKDRINLTSYESKKLQSINATLKRRNLHNKRR